MKNNKQFGRQWIWIYKLNSDTASCHTDSVWNVNWCKKYFLYWLGFWSHRYQKNVQNDSSEFEGSLQEIISKKTFINKEISYINFDGDMKLSTVSNYMKEF